VPSSSTLRHSAAGVLLTHGVPLKVVSEILGHSSIAITGDVYGPVAPDVSRSAVTSSAPSGSEGEPGQLHDFVHG
jgi:site-specific recombinase XerD